LSFPNPDPIPPLLFHNKGIKWQKKYNIIEGNIFIRPKLQSINDSHKVIQLIFVRSTQKVASPSGKSLQIQFTEIKYVGFAHKNTQVKAKKQNKKQINHNKNKKPTINTSC